MNETLQLIAVIAASLVGGLIFFRGWRLGWRYFHHVVSRSDDSRRSDARYFFKQLQFALGGGLLLGATAGGATYLCISFAVWLSAETLAGGAPTKSASPIPAGSVPSSGSLRSVTTKTHVEPAKVEPTKDENSSPAAKPTVVSSDTKEDEGATPKLDARTACEKTRADIERLEIEKQYSGDDEIVRERMGLPPKPTCRD